MSTVEQAVDDGETVLVKLLAQLVNHLPATGRQQ
jgi:hypothetical protein